MCSRAIACVTSPFPFPFKRLPHRLLGMKRYEVCIRIISFSRLNTRAQRDFSRPPARSRDWVARVTIFKERKKFGSLPFLGKKNIRKISVIFMAKNFPVLYILGCLITQQTSVKTERTVENIFFYVRLMTREIYIDAVK